MKYSKYNKGPRQRKCKTDADWIKWFLKADYKRKHPAKPELKSLLEKPRIGDVDEKYGLTFSEYGFIPDSEDWTEEDIKQWKEDVRMRIWSPYDCSGEIFTYWINCHKNPNGLWSYVHHKAMDC